MKIRADTLQATQTALESTYPLLTSVQRTAFMQPIHSIHALGLLPISAVTELLFLDITVAPTTYVLPVTLQAPEAQYKCAATIERMGHMSGPTLGGDLGSPL